VALERMFELYSSSFDCGFLAMVLCPWTYTFKLNHVHLSLLHSSIFSVLLSYFV
jgi:hypothetical protein